VAYKVVFKVIVNQIKPILDKVVAPIQASFVPGQQITDNIVIAREMFHTMRRNQGKKGFMALKIDLEKVYDRLRWPFIRETLLDLNLPIQLVEVIRNCLNCSSFSILWNGETKAFTPSHGVRQGDLLSPYLFVLCMDRLNQIIEDAIIGGARNLVTASRGGPPISRLFFDDNLLLFGEATLKQARAIKQCLDMFCAASEEKVNTQKSMIFFSKNVHNSGMPTIHGRVTKQTFQ